MTAKNGDSVWKSIALVSLAANLTGLASWLALAQEQNPYLQDRAVIMNHLDERGLGTQHETDTSKRQRIREELNVLESKLDTKLKAIADQLTQIKDKMQ